MLSQLDSNPPVSVKSNSSDIKSYFSKILPDFDQDKVLVSDIKKLIKWFNFLNERSLLELSQEEEVLEEEE
jgi:hypothetical protein